MRTRLGGDNADAFSDVLSEEAHKASATETRLRAENSQLKVKYQKAKFDLAEATASFANEREQGISLTDKKAFKGQRNEEDVW